MRESDSKSWLAFLSLLKKYRTRQPINGVILAISLADLIGLDDQQLDAHVVEIRNRLREIHETLKIEFPVYLLFTKADLVAGFMEYFGGFDETAPAQGLGRDIPDRGSQQEHGRRGAGRIRCAGEDAWSEEMPDRLQEEPDPVARISDLRLSGAVRRAQGAGSRVSSTACSIRPAAR